MNHIVVAIELARNKEIFRNTLHGLDSTMVRWKPAPDRWSLLEVICHLYDEELYDFRARVQHVLTVPELPITPIDPLVWVTDNNYMQQDFETMLHNFLTERVKSVNYLNQLVVPRWQNVYQHPTLGPMPASLFLHNWLAHDLHHIRQINEIRYQYLKMQSPDGLEYAGKW